jgi:hypothetical protein
MSEFIYNGKINNLNQRSSEGYDRSRYRSSKNTRSYNGKVQNEKLNMDNHKNYMDSSRSYKGKVQNSLIDGPLVLFAITVMTSPIILCAKMVFATT